MLCLAADCRQAEGRLCLNVVLAADCRQVEGRLCLNVVSSGRLLTGVRKVVSSGRLLAGVRKVVSKCMPIFGTWYCRDDAY
jgi:hypothetical protein